MRSITQITFFDTGAGPVPRGLRLLRASKTSPRLLKDTNAQTIALAYTAQMGPENYFTLMLATKTWIFYNFFPINLTVTVTSWA